MPANVLPHERQKSPVQNCLNREVYDISRDKRSNWSRKTGRSPIQTEG